MPTPSASLERLWLGRLHMATAFAYAPDLAPGVEDEVHGAIAGVDGTEAGVTRIGQLVIVRILSRGDLAGPRGAVQRLDRAAARDRRASRTRPILKC